MSPLSVLHVYKDYPPVVGGIENHLRLLAERQAAQGLDVTVLVTARGGPAGVSVENGVRVIRAARLGEALSTPLSLELAGWLRRLAPDVTHLQFPYPPGELAQLAWGRSRATVVTYQSDIVRQRLTGLAYRPLLHRLLRRADRIIATSPGYLASSPALAGVQERCAVVPLAIDSAAFHPEPGAGRELRDRHPGPLVLFVGRLRYYKGLEHLIDAMAEVPATLLVAGEGRLQAELQRRAARSPAAGRVRFLGHVAQAELLAHYAAADVAVLPSSHRSEAFGLVLLEAMACGRPVVSTELSTGTSWVNRHGDTGLVVPPRDPRALAAALRHLLGDAALRTRMGARARQRVEDEFDASLMVARVLAVYDEALRARTAQASAVRPATASAAPPGGRLPAGAELTPVQRGVLLALLYADLFEYPLTEAELQQSVVGCAATPTEVEAALGALAGLVSRSAGFVTWRGREGLIERRREREALCRPRWEAARRYAAALRRIPFVRALAVCGSQAMENGGPDGDVDFFCITAPGRLWLAQAAAMALRHLLPRGGVELCPNYFVSEDGPPLRERGLYQAHEVLQVVPLFGGPACRAFQQANGWARELLPGWDVATRHTRLQELPVPAATRGLERLLSGGLGGLLDRLVHASLLLYYGLRLRMRGVSLGQVRAAYTRDRQAVVAGGYAAAVAAAFRRRVEERLPGESGTLGLEALFPTPPGAALEAPAVERFYGRLLAQSYGARRE